MKTHEAEAREIWDAMGSGTYHFEYKACSVLVAQFVRGALALPWGNRDINNLDAARLLVIASMKVGDATIGDEEFMAALRNRFIQIIGDKMLAVDSNGTEISFQVPDVLTDEHLASLIYSAHRQAQLAGRTITQALSLAASVGIAALEDLDAPGCHLGESILKEQKNKQ